MPQGERNLVDDTYAQKKTTQENGEVSIIFSKLMLLFFNSDYELRLNYNYKSLAVDGEKNIFTIINSF